MPSKISCRRFSKEFKQIRDNPDRKLDGPREALSALAEALESENPVNYVVMR